MADDTNDTPTPPAPRRRATRSGGTGTKKPAAKPSTDTAAEKPQTTRKRTGAASTPAKPRTTKRAAPSRSAASRSVVGRSVDAVAHTAEDAGAAVSRAAGTVKASARRAGTGARKATNRATKRVDTATQKVGGRWGAAAIAGGVAAIGAAATAALLSLRSSTPKPAPAPKGGAHQPDGTDSSASFKAGIADENTIPE